MTRVVVILEAESVEQEFRIYGFPVSIVLSLGILSSKNIYATRTRMISNQKPSFLLLFIE